jgi:hypothetical protein
MPDLIHSLQNHDLGHLRIVAALWGVELAAVEPELALQELVGELLKPERVLEIVEALPVSARQALASLVQAGGRLPWAGFERQFGEIREAGPGRRDRERIYLHPTSSSEWLFYRALLARAFFDGPAGAQEYAYLPDELIGLTAEVSPMVIAAPLLPPSPPGRPASVKERQVPMASTDQLLDDATTLLAAVRMGDPLPETEVPPAAVRAFLESAGLLVGDSLNSTAVRDFLRLTGKQAISWLGQAWKGSETFNELRMLPGLVCEGEWINQPQRTRLFLLKQLEALPKEKWWSLAEFVRAIKEQSPDFQRPVGDYDSWFIRRLADGSYLRGFESWEEVDGALIRFFIQGPLFWLRRVDLARAEASGPVSAFKVNARLTAGLENGTLSIASGGRISVPDSVPRAARYLISRFCNWEGEKHGEYQYRVSTQSLAKARQQGLKVNQLLSLLAKHAAAEIPPAFIKALKRWELQGIEACLEEATILKVSRPQVLEELRRSRAGRFLGESLGPAAVVVRPGAQAKVLAALAEMGLMAEEVPSGGGRP